MGAQIIVTEKGERLAVLPEADYLALVELADDASDLAHAQRIQTAIAAGEEELVPSTFVDRILSGESPVRVWREHRGMSIEALATRSGLTAGTIGRLERGQGAGSLTSLTKIAPVLGVTVDDLLPANRSDDAN